MITNKQDPNSQAHPPTVLHEENLLKIDNLLQTNVRIGKESHTVQEWLNTPNCSLRAGFQAAAIAAFIEDQLFFLEHLNQYLTHLKKYMEFSKTQEKILDADDELQRFLQEKNQPQAEQALQQALSLLNEIWTECINEQGSFHLNISLSSIWNAHSGFESAAKEGKKIIEQISVELQLLNHLKVRKRLIDIPKIYLELFNQPETTPDKLMLDTINNANLIIARILPGILGDEGIQQTKAGEKAFNEALTKWGKVNSLTPPEPWGPRQALLAKKMKNVGNLICAWAEEHSHAGKSKKSQVSNSFNVAPLLSPRYQGNPIISKEREDNSLLTSSGTKANESISNKSKNRKSLNLTFLMSHNHQDKSKKLKENENSSSSLFSHYPEAKSVSVQSRPSFSLFSIFSHKSDNYTFPTQEELEHADQIRKLTLPPTQSDIILYHHLIEKVNALKDKKYQKLKRAVEEEHSLSFHKEPHVMIDLSEDCATSSLSQCLTQ
ncbi:hypothetical protein DGG96_13235 [Legionella qingyii]|uniref:Uncharacterized protein n=1 Tax=Legionella qingyii TaxID=2184757 RepID=A0A317U192_9GAMM|nr:hypothetical protein [Legionella qingyii]PWY55139.1 hypothetical protein DGG96_13235 [Legionella qingyii]RUR25438.1 hypothetical protein ELY20_02990 [Legionella qingyii]RUR28451.1 hypothetical protein ELY16_03020 [Legionella qingyii]